MNKVFSSGLLSLAVLAAPAAAFAQSGPPGGPPGAGMYSPSPAQRQAMQQARAQMEQVHAQERSQILGALSPAHRSLLSNIAGGLATGQVASRQVAAQQLDAALSSQEKQAVVNISQSTRSQMQAMRQQHMQQMLASMPADQQAKMQQHMQQMQARGNRTTRTPDPGMIVLRATVGGGGDREMGPGGPHGPGGF